jgi:hypothetical protein
MGAVQPAPSFNTIVSFVTNTNGQNYGVEETMSYFGKAGESAASNLGPHSEVGGVCTRHRGAPRRTMTRALWADPSADRD